MSSNTGNTPASTPRRLIDRPVAARRLLGRDYSQGNTNQVGTPARGLTSSSRQSHGSQGSVIFPQVTNLIASESPVRAGRPSPSIPLEPSVGAGPPLLPSALIGTGLHFDYSFRYSPFPALSPSEHLRSSLSTCSADSLVSERSSASEAQEVHSNVTQSAFSPGTRVEIVNGKRRMTQDNATSLSTSAEETTASQNSKTASDSAESESGNLPRLQIIEYMIPDSDEASSSTEHTEEGSTGEVLASSNSSNHPKDIVSNRLKSMENVPSIGSDSVTESDSEYPVSSEPAPLGTTPFFMAHAGVTSGSSPITIRSSSEAPQPTARTTRLSRHDSDFFVEKPLDPGFVRGVQRFNPVKPVSFLLHDVAHPGPGITVKELQAILRKCDICNKFAYILSEGKHVCNHLAEASINSPLFELQGYLSVYDEPLGISQEQLAKVFVQCYFCDRVVWCRKKANHICPRDIRARAARARAQGNASSGSHRSQGQGNASGARGNNRGPIRGNNSNRGSTRGHTSNGGPIRSNSNRRSSARDRASNHGPFVQGSSSNRGRA
ncbi:hypothetical protein BKA70DRAFT_1440152 [Coprinopsis sp. MPI-PUGE-AT-0042]|nr:hypothetical protein BKA70DRAFT_1440152 [Coprinopsis sp. MPI-PUGE-AT-0042]